MLHIRRYLGLRKNSVILFVATFVMVILLAVCVFSVSMNVYTGVFARTQTNQSLERIQAFAQGAEGNLAKLREAASQVEYNTFIRDWLNSPFVATNLMDIKNILANNNAIVTANPQLFSIDIYNKNDRKVLSTYSGYYDVDTPAASAVSRSMQFLSFAAHHQRSTQILTDNGHGKVGLLTFLKDFHSANGRGVIAVSGDILHLLPDAPENIRLFLLDNTQEGFRVSVNTPGGPIAPQDHLLLDEQAQLPAWELRQATLADQTPVNVIAYPIFSGHMTLVAIFPQYRMAQVFAQNTDVVVLGIAALCLACLLLTWSIIKLAYRPLQRLLKKTQEAEEIPAGGPIRRLETIMARYITQEEALRNSLDMNRALVHERALRDLLFGRTVQDASPPAIVRPEDNHFVVVVLAFARPDDTSRGESLRVGADIEAAAQALLAAAAAHAPCEKLHLSPLQAVLLINYRRKPPVTELPRAFEDAARSIPKDIALSIGISNLGCAAEDLPELYEQAAAAARMTCEREDGIVTTYQDMVQNDNRSMFWEAIRPLISSLRTGGMAAVDTALDQLFAKHVGIRPDEREPFLLYLVAYINRVSQSFGASLHEILDEDPFDAFCEKQGPADQHAYIRSICGRVLTQRTDSDKQYKRASVELAVQYLKVNFDKPLSLSFLAEELGISPSYLSELLKKELGMNYLKYVQSLRMDRAKELLAETASPVKEIALVVGYDSEHSFIRNFKALEHMTPSQYRAQFHLVKP